ncbi:transcriptional regulator [Cellulomonas sp. 179-A 9B4 NHS]|uniref:transcriptional regulator n=1 Tax=Cellulomonas sp. 179-A 9B4 NHS TaxID=3142379 RepID=UPI0039A12007
MSAPEPRFDDVVHARNRLQICAMLARVDALAFPTVREALDVEDYVVSKHLKVLVDAGYVSSRKERHHGRTQTWLRLTDDGRHALERHLAELRRILAADDAG